MTPSNDICPVCSYAGSAIYCECPSAEQRRTGVVPLDSLPAAWWNKMWADTTNRINEARDMVGQLITEVNNVLAAANINPQAACTDQLYQSINLIRQRLATATVAGSIVSSSDPNEVAVDANGKATVNCLGNTTSLTTTASTVVGAINELKSTYDCCISDINTCTGSLGTGKAPNMHASANTTYGVGNATCYGHVKLSDTYDSVLSECSGVAASQYALATAYACLIACAGAPLGNTAGCALGTAAAGSASTAARSDHVHPKPTCVACSGQSYCVMDFGNTGTPLYVGFAGSGLNCSQIGYIAGYSTSYCSGRTVLKNISKDNLKSWLGLGSAAYCDAGSFRPSSWTPTGVCCACYIPNSNCTAWYRIYVY